MGIRDRLLTKVEDAPFAHPGEAVEHLDHHPTPLLDNRWGWTAGSGRREFLERKRRHVFPSPLSRNTPLDFPSLFL
jgi:hypothetical protein